MSEAQTIEPQPQSVLDQYKAYLADLGNFGTRYTTSNGFYLSVITALLGILALAKPSDVLAGSRTYLGFAVSAFAVLVCMVWSRSVASYRKLFAIKFDILREMEKKGNLFPIYKLENEMRGKVALLENERLIPILLSLPFLTILVWSGFKLFR
jgi:hypothetical protein